MLVFWLSGWFWLVRFRNRMGCDFCGLVVVVVVVVVVLQWEGCTGGCPLVGRCGGRCCSGGCLLEGHCALEERNFCKIKVDNVCCY